MAAPKKEVCGGGGGGGRRRRFLELFKTGYNFATDKNDFRRNLVVNLGLFAVGIWIARNLSDIDLMAPQPLQ
ncbi:mitochondrial import receptor subunit TOM6 homolog [Callorhinchus milii]|uniref:mitochondrial import receptor subunit TOM6 homolog n=1 Tax=Callorhinchus milii TaxID=7868 RepID=UPI0004574E7D|nr:mitochondrial import receptor subunit TOM6 homolog [Callorhinchus milii]|eukprot:gi/632963117/ref/XP_007897702.1/ PREDICTED: mitochondrial import receptor subunit TOM6 homolog [Callorhinchus milii]